MTLLMTTVLLPVNLGHLILAIFLLLPAVCYLASYEANRDATKRHRREMREAGLAINARTVQVLQDEQHVEEEWQALWDARFAVHERELAVAERELAVAERERNLGRSAHDAWSQAQLALHQANDDTAIAMPRFEDWKELGS